MLRADPQGARLGARAEAAIDLAVADGARLALMWAGDPWEVAARLGVSVVWVEGSNRVGTRFQFAEYSGKPARILLYRGAMETLRGVIAREGLAERLGVEDAAPVYLAHEIYHHLDQGRTERIAKAAEVTIFAVGPARWRSGLVAMGEIGACAFAAAVTGLRCHPRVLDVLALREVAPVVAASHVAAASMCDSLPAG